MRGASESGAFPTPSGSLVHASEKKRVYCSSVVLKSERTTNTNPSRPHLVPIAETSAQILGTSVQIYRYDGDGDGDAMYFVSLRPKASCHFQIYRMICIASIEMFLFFQDVHSRASFCERSLPPIPAKLKPLLSCATPEIAPSPLLQSGRMPLRDATSRHVSSHTVI